MHVPRESCHTIVQLHWPCWRCCWGGSLQEGTRRQGWESGASVDAGVANVVRVVGK